MKNSKSIENLSDLDKMIESKNGFSAIFLMIKKFNRKSVFKKL